MPVAENKLEIGNPDELILIWSPEMRPPLSNQDSLTRPKGGQIRGSPLYVYILCHHFHHNFSGCTLFPINTMMSAPHTTHLYASR